MLYHGKVFNSFFRHNRLQIASKFVKLLIRKFQKRKLNMGGGFKIFYFKFWEKMQKKINRFVVDLSLVALLQESPFLRINFL